MRLIDADALEREYQERYKLFTWDDGEREKATLARVIQMLHAQPTIEERKTGKWNFIGDQMFECTECGTCYTQSQFYQMRVRISDTEFPKFCPNCGADMRGEG